MNVAVRAIAQTTLPRIFSWTLSKEKQGIIVGFLCIAVLFSAFGIIYVKDVNRRLETELQNLQMTQASMRAQWSQLLLEKSTWSADARVENIAVHHLDMVLPKTKAIITI